MNSVSTLKGIGGWLALLIIGLCILGPLAGIGQLSADFEGAEKATPDLATHASWAAYKQYMWSAFALSAVISFSAGFRLWKIHTPQSVRFAIAALWLANPVAAMAYFLVAYFAFGPAILEQVNSLFVSKSISPVIVASIWTLYLLKSARVENTYYGGLPTWPAP